MPGISRTQGTNSFSDDFVNRDFVNGSFKETFDALVTSDGATITMTLEQSGTGDLTMQFSDGDTLLDCTPALTIALTAGSDASPQANYIYIPQSTKVLTKSTTGFPTSSEHIKVGYFFVPSATHVQSEGAYINQNWNDHLMGTDNEGHMLHMAERSRRDGAYYFSGIDAGGNDQTPAASYFDYVGASESYFKSTAGVIYQMHRHTVPAFDTSTAGDDFHVINWNGSNYRETSNIADIVADSGGNSLSNKYFNLFFFAVGNKTGEYAPFMCMLPDGSYNSQVGAEQDTNGYDNLTMPRQFSIDSSTGVPICRMTLRWAGGTTTLTHISTVDLRTGGITASGGAAGDLVNFPDNQFTVYDETDTTKILAFDVGTSVTTGTTRTLIIPDENGTIITSATTNYVTLTDGSSADALHTHTGASLSSIDISNDTNLAVTAPIVLTDDTISISLNAAHLEESGGSLQIVANGIDDTLIDWGVGAGQVSAVDVPIADAGGYYTGTEVETALQEIGAGTTLDGVYLRLDATNDPVTGALDLNNTLDLDAAATATYAADILNTDATAGSHGLKLDSTAANSFGLDVWAEGSNVATLAKKTITLMTAVKCDTNLTVDASAIFNEDSNIGGDLRWESDANTHGIFGDASDNRVGIMTSLPGETLDVNGTLKVQGSSAVFDQAVVVNEDSTIGGDFRVESNSDTHALFVDAGNNEVIVNENGTTTNFRCETPNSTFAFYISSSTNTVNVNANNDDVDFLAESVNGQAFKVDAAANVVFVNEASEDIDFRVKSDNGHYPISVDAGNDRLGIGTLSPTDHLEVAGGNIIFELDAASPYNFNIKGNTDDNLLFVKGADDEIGIGNNNPSYKLHITGTFGVSSTSVFTGTATFNGDVDLDDGLQHTPTATGDRSDKWLMPQDANALSNIGAGAPDYFYNATYGVVVSVNDTGTEYLDWGIQDAYNLYGGYMKVRKITIWVHMAANGDYITENYIYRNQVAGGLATPYSNTTNYGSAASGHQSYTIYNSTGISLSTDAPYIYEVGIENNSANGCRIKGIQLEYERVLV